MLHRTLLAALTALLLALSGALVAGPAAVVAAPSWTWPVQGEVLTGYRNGDDPYAGGQHRGVDIAAELGTEVTAAAGGTVRFAGVAGSSGLTVSVRTGDGRYDTSYLHLSSVSVGEGDEVGAGDAVGAVGTTGRRSADAPHLHFGVRDAGSRHAYHDPLSFLPPPAPRLSPQPQPPPKPVPVPVTGPVPVGPVPAPVRLPSGRRVRAPGERRVRVPAGRRVRLPSRGRVPLAAPAPVPSAQGSPARVPALGPGTAALPDHHRAPAHGGAQAPAPARGSAPAAGPAPVLESLERPATPERGAEAPRPAPAGGGPDIGWAAACAGLLLAAALLGRPGERDAAGQGAGVKLRTLLRPLTGRH